MGENTIKQLTLLVLISICCSNAIVLATKSPEQLSVQEKDALRKKVVEALKESVCSFSLNRDMDNTYLSTFKSALLGTFIAKGLKEYKVIRRSKYALLVVPVFVILISAYTPLVLTRISEFLFGQGANLLVNNTINCQDLITKSIYVGQPFDQLRLKYLQLLGKHALLPITDLSLSQQIYNSIKKLFGRIKNEVPGILEKELFEHVAIALLAGDANLIEMKELLVALGLMKLSTEETKIYQGIQNKFMVDSTIKQRGKALAQNPAEFNKLLVQVMGNILKDPALISIYQWTKPREPKYSIW